jgi:hypothetical protein
MERRLIKRETSLLLSVSLWICISVNLGTYQEEFRLLGAMAKRSNETTYSSHKDLVTLGEAEAPVIEECPACAHAFDCSDGMLRTDIYK